MDHFISEFLKKVGLKGREGVVAKGQEFGVGVGETVYVGRNPKESRKLGVKKLEGGERIVRLDSASCGVTPKDVSRLCVSIGVGSDGRLGVEMDPKCSNKVTVVLSSSGGLSEEIDSEKAASRARDIGLRARGSSGRLSLMKIRIAAGEKVGKYIDLVCVGVDENGEYRFVVATDQKKEIQKQIAKERKMGLEEVYGEPPEVVEYSDGRKMYVYSGEELAKKDERPWGRWHIAKIGTKGGDLYMVMRTATLEAHKPMDAEAVVVIEKEGKTIINYVRADGVTTITGVDEPNKSGLFAGELVRHMVVKGLGGVEQAVNKIKDIEAVGSATVEMGQVIVRPEEHEIKGQTFGSTRGKYDTGAYKDLWHVGDAGTSAIYEGQGKWAELPEASKKRVFVASERMFDSQSLSNFGYKGTSEGWITATDGGLFVGFDGKLQKQRLMNVLDVCRSHAEGRITGSQMAELLRDNNEAFSTTDDISMLVFVPKK